MCWPTVPPALPPPLPPYTININRIYEGDGVIEQEFFNKNSHSTLSGDEANSKLDLWKIFEIKLINRIYI